mmetsp:Transcript_1922/g.1897  ORF Transcript_1922/g.1897 Transcript_1922/m.1897 type:complete len:129 (+) Transcript_1922:44-430(+)
MFLISFILTSIYFIFCQAGTQIKVLNEYKKELNVKIQGSGVGGCDILLQPGEENDSSCWCLWGTINYSFCAYSQSPLGNNNTNVESGKCPVVPGESGVCSDLSSLGNCYDGAYFCKIDSTGLCHCETI